MKKMICSIGEYFTRPELCVGAKIIVLSHEEEFIMRDDYIPSMKDQIGIITSIESDTHDNLSFNITITVGDSNHRIQLFEDEFAIVNAWKYNENCINLKLYPKSNKEKVKISRKNHAIVRDGLHIDYNILTKEFKVVKNSTNQTVKVKGLGTVGLTLHKERAKEFLKQIGKDFTLESKEKYIQL